MQVTMKLLSIVCLSVVLLTAFTIKPCSAYYVYAWDPNGAAKIDMSNGTVEDINVGMNGVLPPAPGERYIYFGSGGVKVYDQLSGEYFNVIPSTNNLHVVANDNVYDSHVYIAEIINAAAHQSKVYVLSKKTNTVLNEFVVNSLFYSNNYKFTSTGDEGFAYVSSPDLGCVKINLSNGSVVGTYNSYSWNEQDSRGVTHTVTWIPKTMSFDPKGKFLYLTGGYSPSTGGYSGIGLAVVSVETGLIVSTKAVPATQTSVSHDGNIVYYMFDSYVCRLDTGLCFVLPTSIPHGAAYFSFDNKSAFIPSECNVYMVDVPSNSLAKTIGPSSFCFLVGAFTSDYSSSTNQETSKNNGLSSDPAIPQACEGNPVNPGTGNKFQSEIDYSGSPNGPLEFRRNYNSQDNTSTTFGTGWRGTYQRTLVQQSASTIVATRDNGKTYTFRLVNGNWQADPDVSLRLAYELMPYGTYSFTLTDEENTKEYYGGIGGQLSYMLTRSGHGRRFSYDLNRNLASITTYDSMHVLMSFSYDTFGHVSQITNPDGTIIKYSYDTKNNLISVTYPDGTIRQYLYENTSYPNALTGIVDENGNRFSTYAYDSKGRATSTEHAGSAEKVNLVYNSDGTVNVTDGLGAARDYTFTTQFDLVKPTAMSNQGCSCGSKAYTYDTNGFLASKTDFNGNVTTYTRDARGLELTRTEAAGTPQARTITTIWHQTYRLPLSIAEPNRTTAFTYDANGNMLTKTVTADSLTRTLTYTYDAYGRVLTLTDPKGNTTAYNYVNNGYGDNLDVSIGKPGEITNALHQTIRINYDANGWPLSITEPTGLVIALLYDKRGHLISRSAGTQTTTYTYDAVGSLTKVTFPDNSFVSCSYDMAHRLTGVADKLGNHIAYTLDAMGNRIKEEVFDNSNHLVQTRAHTYDQLNRLAQDIGAQNQTITYGHDNNGNLTSVADPLSHISQLSYDALNRLIKSTDPISAVTNIAYNANDMTSSVTDARGLVTTYAYDGLGDRTSTQSPDTGTTTKTYDAAGNVLTLTDARGKKMTYAYDTLNRVTTVTLSDGVVFRYSYDSGSYGIGHLESLMGNATNYNYAYNINGNVVSNKFNYNGLVTLTTNYQYDSATGKLSGMTYPSGRQLSYVYDTVSGKLVGIKVGNASLVGDITYQPFGPVASWTQGNGKTYARSFNLDGRLVGLAIGGSAPETVALTYDAAGRITGIVDSAAVPKIANTGTTVFYYGSTNNWLGGISSGGRPKGYSYDSDGNTVGIDGGTITFRYDARGRLVQAIKGGVTTRYILNGLGQRVAKTGSGVDTGAVYFVYDEAGHLIGEYDASGNVIGETVWLGDLPVGVLKAGAQYYVNPDHLGAPLSITDANGKAVWRWDRDPYGNGKPNENPSGLGTFTYNLRFPGQYYDKETELHYNYYRDYNPRTGRYVQSDPIGLEGGMNMYGYAGGNPLSFVDKQGLNFLSGLSEVGDYKDISDGVIVGLSSKTEPYKDQFILPPFQLKEAVARTVYSVKFLANYLYETFSGSSEKCSSFSTPEEWKIQENARELQAVQNGQSYMPRIYDFELDKYNQQRAASAVPGNGKSYFPMPRIPDSVN